MGSPRSMFRSSVKIVQVMQHFALIGGGRHNESSDSGSEQDHFGNEGAPIMKGQAAVTKGRPGWRLPRDIPHGYMAVYVGDERKRFVISTHYLSHRLFKSLLKKSEEEFGFVYEGGLAIACEPVLFEHILWLIGSNDPIAQTTELGDLMEFYEEQRSLLH